MKFVEMWNGYSKIAVTLLVSPVPMSVCDCFVFMVCFVSRWWGRECEEVSNQDHFPTVTCSETGPSSYKKVPSVTPPIIITGMCIIHIYRPIKGNYRIHYDRLNLGTALMAWELSNQAFHSDWSCRFNNAKEGWAQPPYEFINYVYCTYSLPVSLRPGIIKYEWQHLNYSVVVPAHSSSKRILLEHNYWAPSSSWQANQPRENSSSAFYPTGKVKPNRSSMGNVI